jgi:hypothetical protein
MVKSNKHFQSINNNSFMGYNPNHNYGDYRKTWKIKESAQISDGIVAVGDILSSFQTIITKML